MNAPAPRRDPGSASPQRGSAVSAATIPLLFLGLMVGFFSGYFLLWLSLIHI